MGLLSPGGAVSANSKGFYHLFSTRGLLKGETTSDLALFPCHSTILCHTGMLTSEPPQVPWVASVLGLQGLCTGMGMQVNMSTLCPVTISTFPALTHHL